jgi:hypothetical protein
LRHICKTVSLQKYFIEFFVKLMLLLFGPFGHLVLPVALQPGKEAYLRAQHVNAEKMGKKCNL